MRVNEIAWVEQYEDMFGELDLTYMKYQRTGGSGE